MNTITDISIGDSVLIFTLNEHRHIQIVKDGLEAFILIGEKTCFASYHSHQYVFIVSVYNMGLLVRCDGNIKEKYCEFV